MPALQKRAGTPTKSGQAPARPYEERKAGASSRSPKVADQTLKEEPQPQVDLTLGLLNLKPAPSRVSM